MQQTALKAKAAAHDVPLTKWQQRGLSVLRGLFAGYAGRELRVPHLSRPLDIPQCEITLDCAGYGEVLRVEIVLRESRGWGYGIPAGPIPEANVWSGHEMRFRWECTARGKARWVGVAPAMVLRAAAQ